MKKILSLILCACILLSSSMISMAGTPADSVKILNALGVMQGDPNGNMRENDLVKRSEFAKMAVLLSAYKNKVSLNSKISVFTDCTADHWAAPYVRVAAENGIIEGYSNGIFGPDDNINYAQAVTIALRLLGYTDADFGNTYPEGQLAMAQSLKLGEGLSKGSEEFMTRLDVAVVLNNMLLTSKKDSGTNYIESINYKIKEDTVIVATNDEDASVAPGKVFTTNGEYVIDSSFDKTLVGCKGSAISDSEGKLLTLVKHEGYADKYSVNAVGSGFVSLVGAKGTMTLQCDDGTLSYKGTTKTNFGSLKS
ncbi:MAG: S-layer homology domain-containing protein, partial [Clostridia bacterium]|nr:S-layer homology domain-containing protein [Clostridia bacterium]